MDAVVVDELYVGPRYQTDVWASEAVLKADAELKSGSKKQKQLANKIEYYAQAGFRNHEGDRRPIRSEGDGVFRIGRHGDLFRILLV